jgi:hypothetical protein
MEAVYIALLVAKLIKDSWPWLRENLPTLIKQLAEARKAGELKLALTGVEAQVPPDAPNADKIAKLVAEVSALPPSAPLKLPPAPDDPNADKIAKVVAEVSALLPSAPLKLPPAPAVPLPAQAEPEPLFAPGPKVPIPPETSRELYGSRVEEPDLTVRVISHQRSGEPLRLEYRLKSKDEATGGYSEPDLGEVTVTQKELEDEQAELNRQLELLSQGKDMDGIPIPPGQVMEEMRATGDRLFQLLFPPQLQAVWKEIRDNRNIVTLQLFSDEPWGSIPWELVRLPPPEGAEDEDARDLFFCLRFEMTRWLKARMIPQTQFEVQTLACVAVTRTLDDRPLGPAEAENKYFRDLLTKYPQVTDRSPAAPTREAVIHQLGQGGVNLWHFCCHGEFSPKTPDSSGMWLLDGVLRAKHIIDQFKAHVREDRPLIFMNACRVGQKGWALTWLGGWVTKWVQDCYCGALVAPLWKVEHSLAYDFAKNFYDALDREKMTIAQAVRKARMRAKAVAEYTPFWAAYCVYANPNARVRFGTPAGAPAGGVRP